MAQRLKKARTAEQMPNVLSVLITFWLQAEEGCISNTDCFNLISHSTKRTRNSEAPHTKTFMLFFFLGQKRKIENHISAENKATGCRRQASVKEKA